MKKKFNKKIYFLLSITLGLINFFFLVINYSAAFVGPSSSPGSGGGALYLDANGNVGFGTTDPSVTGFGRIFAISSTSNPGIYLKATTRSYIVYASSSGNLSFYDVTAGADRLYIDSSGNVIGTVFVGTLSGDISSANVSSGVFGSLQGNGSFAFPASLGVATSSKTGLPQSLSVYGSGYFSQKLGIGTFSPSATLDVVASSTTVGLRVQGESGGTQKIVDFKRSNGDSVFSIYATGSILLHGYDILTSGGSFTGLSELSIGTTTSASSFPTSSMLLVDGGGYFISPVTVGTPTSDGHAATKAYVDASAGLWTLQDINSLKPSSDDYFVSIGGNAEPGVKFAVRGGRDLYTIPILLQVQSNTSDTKIASFQTGTSEVFSVDREGDIFSTGLAGSPINFYLRNSSSSNFVADGENPTGLPVYFKASPGDSITGGFTFTTYDSNGTTKTHTSGVNNFLSIDLGFSPTSGTGEQNLLVVSSTINQTGGASGITRGLYINPTLTSASDWRSIEVTRGNSLFGTTSGNLGIATTTPGYSLTAVGTGYFSQPVIVGTPVSNSQAATKAYVDSAVSGITGSYWLQSGSYLYPSSTSWKIGIGTTTPTYALDVVGNFRVSATTTISGNWELVGAAQGNINMNNYSITSVNKLTVTTIDPLYEIAGKKYATYVSDTIGLKMELYGKGQLKKYENNYIYSIDFKNAQEGSDEWLFWQTIDEGKGMKDITLVLTPEGSKASLWYTLLSDEKRIVIFGDNSTKFSYHLVAPRHDAKKWPTLTQTKESGVPLKLR